MHHYHNSYLHYVSHILRRGRSPLHSSNIEQIYHFPICSSPLKATGPRATEHDIANIRLNGPTVPSELKVSWATFKRVFE